jgi:ribosomal protein L22
MSPENPQDPQKGKPDEAKVAEEAAAAKVEAQPETPAQPEPTASDAEAAPQAEGTAAAETGDDAAGEDEGASEEVPAEAAEDPGVATPFSDEEQVVPDKPKRRSRAKQADDEQPRRGRAKKADDEPPAEEATPARRRRDERRPVPVGLTVRAQAKYVRTSARKARLVCDHIRGKDVAEARAILAFTPRSAAKAWIKLLESAVANAEHNHELVGEDLRILSVHADEGPTLKRFRPRAMGRATRIRKRTSHLSITLTPKES